MTETMPKCQLGTHPIILFINEYLHDRVQIIFIIFCFYVHWTKATSAAEELMLNSHIIFHRDIATDNMIRVSIKHELVLQIKAYFSSSILQRVIAADNTMGEHKA